MGQRQEYDRAPTAHEGAKVVCRNHKKGCMVNARATSKAGSGCLLHWGENDGRFHPQRYTALRLPGFSKRSSVAGVIASKRRMAGVAPTSEPKSTAHIVDLASTHQSSECASYGNNLCRGHIDVPVFFGLDRIDRFGNLERVNRTVACLDEMESGARDAPRTSGHGGLTLSVAMICHITRSQHLSSRLLAVGVTSQRLGSEGCGARDLADNCCYWQGRIDCKDELCS